MVPPLSSRGLATGRRPEAIAEEFGGGTTQGDRETAPSHLKPLKPPHVQLPVQLLAARPSATLCQGQVRYLHRARALARPVSARRSRAPPGAGRWPAARPASLVLCPRSQVNEKPYRPDVGVFLNPAHYLGYSLGLGYCT